MRQQKLPISTFSIINNENYKFLSDWIKNTNNRSIDAICGIWKESASRLQRRSRLKMLTMDGLMTDACLYYKLTYEPSAQVS